MPRTIITERDNTTAVRPTYPSFSVVVPGLVFNTNEAVIKNYFDENGVYECNNVSEFENVVLNNYKSADNATAINISAKVTVEVPDDFISPTIRKVETSESGEHNEINPIENIETDGKITQEKFNEVKNSGNLYIATEAAEEAQPGELCDGTYEYTLVKANDDYNSGALYVWIEADQIGTNAETIEYYQYGAQMALKLIEMGYTVLYKKIDDTYNFFKNQDGEYLGNFFEPLKDRSLYDFRYIVTGLINDTEFNVSNAIIDVAEKLNKTQGGRGDVVALIDVPYTLYTGNGSPLSQSTAIKNIQNGLNTLNDSSFEAVFAPFVKYTSVDSHFMITEVVDINDRQQNMVTDSFLDGATYPATFHYLACAAKAFNLYNEWYAVSGYTRGVSDYVIASTGCKFGENAANVLQPRIYSDGGVSKAINLIIKTRTGYLLWGNRTAKILDTEGLKATHFLNIRQLCITLNKTIYEACTQLRFDPNSDLLWIKFRNKIRPTLEKMKGDQGIDDYDIIQVVSNQRAELAAQVRIVPVEAVEDFSIEVTLEDSISGDTTVEITEED